VLLTHIDTCLMSTAVVAYALGNVSVSKNLSAPTHREGLSFSSEDVNRVRMKKQGHLVASGVW
jgi:hypothetical protein